jgi:ATP-binding cassette subfamily C protein CydC
VYKPHFFQFIIKLLKPVFWSALFSIALGSLTILSGIGLIGTSAYLIGFAALQPSIAVLQVAIIGVRFFGLSRSVFRYLERITSHSVNLKMVSRLRLWFYKKVESLTPIKIRDINSGDLTSRALQDIETLDQFFIRVLAPVSTAVIVIIGTSFFIASFEKYLGWITFILLGGVGFFLFLLSIRVQRKILSEYSSVRGDLHSLITGMVEGVADIRVNGDAAIFQNLLLESQNGFAGVQKKSTGLVALLNALLPLISGLGFVVIFITSTVLFEHQSLDPKLIGVAALLVMASFEAFQTFPQLGQNLVLSQKAVERIFEIINIDHNEPEKRQYNRIAHFSSIIMENVVFNYAEDPRNVFNELSFSIKKGEKIAIVGPSGAGKTSLINLVLRYWEPQSGSVLINKIPIQEVGAEELRNLVRTSSQNPYFFADSIKENLMLANRAASEENLNDALYCAQCMDWVKDLQHGLDTLIGDRGSKLSEGQRKRLDIARVLVSRPELVILDEPFSGLDSITARNLQNSILHNGNIETLILITHNLFDLTKFDEILFLNDGKILEKGNLNELIRNDGHFARMYNMQKNIII